MVSRNEVNEMTAKAQHYIDKEVTEQVARVSRFIEQKPQMTDEQINMCVKTSEAYLYGISKACEEFGLIDFHERNDALKQFREQVQFDPIDGVYIIK